MKTILQKTENKTAKLTALCVLFLASFFVHAGTGLKSEGTEQTIRQHIKFPKLILPVEKNEKVEVIFTTAPNGKVDFVLARTSNQDLKKEIEKQFMGMSLPKLKANVAHSIVFNFKTI